MHPVSTLIFETFVFFLILVLKGTYTSSKSRSTPTGKKAQGKKEMVQDMKHSGTVVNAKTDLKGKNKVVKALVFSSPMKKGKQETRNINLNALDAERSTELLKDGPLLPNHGRSIKKAMPTIPKPFRLRTEVRFGI